MANILFVSSIILLFGLYLLVANENKRKLLEHVHNWPVTTGMIVESHVSYARPKMDESDGLTFCYQYHVDGVSHIGWHLDMFAMGCVATVEEMEAVATSYVPGAKVKVYYDPNNSKLSLLEPDNRVGYYRNRNFAYLIMSIGVLVLSGLLFV